MSKKLTEGTQVVFPEGNRIRYSQDFSIHTGIPEEVIFTIENCEIFGRYRLTAKGYGKKGDYGNGAIYVLDYDVENRAQATMLFTGEEAGPYPKIDACKIQILKSIGVRLTDQQLANFLKNGWKIEVVDGKRTLYKPIV